MRSPPLTRDWLQPLLRVIANTFARLFGSAEENAISMSSTALTARRSKVVQDSDTDRGR